MDDEKQILENELLQYAEDDLESARIILKESDNYHNPQLRYPTGEQITREEAEKSLAIAEKIFKLFKS